MMPQGQEKEAARTNAAPVSDVQYPSDEVSACLSPL
jgi:hypothetical protein